MNCLAVMNTRQATRAILGQFWYFLGSGLILIEEEDIINGLVVIGG